MISAWWLIPAFIGGSMFSFLVIALVSANRDED